MDQEGVLCPRCEEKRPIEDFDHPVRGRRHGYCRPCRRSYNRDWYRRNKARHIAQVRRDNERHLARNRKYVEQQKDAPCTDCGQRFPTPVMEFDHVRGEKVTEVVN